MAVNEISQHFITKFATDTIHLAQQTKSKLRATVTEQFDVANKFIFKTAAARGAMTQRANLGVNAGKRTATAFVDQVWNNRVVTPLEYVAADSFRAADAKRKIESPRLDLAKAFAAQVGRQWDDIIIAAFFANAPDDLGTANAHPAANQIGGAAIAPSLALIKTAREILAENEIDPDEERYFVCSPNYITALLNDTAIGSSDYNTVKALVEGKVEKFMGFRFIESNRLTSPGGAGPYQRYAAAYTKSSMGLAVNTELEVDVGPAAHLSFDTVVQVRIDAGATRVQDAQMVRVHYLETN